MEVNDLMVRAAMQHSRILPKCIAILEGAGNILIPDMSLLDMFTDYGVCRTDVSHLPLGKAQCQALFQFYNGAIFSYEIDQEGLMLVGVNDFNGGADVDLENLKLDVFAKATESLESIRKVGTLLNRMEYTEMYQAIIPVSEPEPLKPISESTLLTAIQVVETTGESLQNLLTVRGEDCILLKGGLQVPYAQS